MNKNSQFCNLVAVQNISLTRVENIIRDLNTLTWEMKELIEDLRSENNGSIQTMDEV